MTTLRLGIDIGGSSIKAALHADARIVVEASSERYVRPDAPTLRAALRSVCDQLRLPERAHAAASSLHAGVAVPGLPDPSGRRIGYSANLPGLMELDLPDELAAAARAPLRSWRIVTDSLASAYGYWSLERRPGRLLSLVIGTGVGASVLDNGTPLHVVDRCPGHIGQIDVGPIGSDISTIGPDGGAGSLEAYASAAGLRARFGDDIIPALLAVPITDPAYVALTRAIRICLAIYRPDEVVLLGGIGTRLGPRLAELDGAVRTHLTRVVSGEWRLSVGASDNYGALGAAALAVDSKSGARR